MSKLSPSKKAEFKRLSANVDKDYSQFEVQVRVLHQIDCASADWSWLFAMHQLVDAAFVVLWQSVSELFYFLEEDELETAEVKALMDTLIGERLKYVVDSLSRLEEAFKIGRAKRHKFWTLVNPSTSIRPHISLRPQAWVADVYEEEPAAVIEHLKTTLNDEGASFFQLLQGFNEQCRLFSSDTLCMDNMPSIQVSMWYRDIKKAYDNHYEAFFCLWGHVQDHPDEWVVDSELHKIGEDIVEELEVFVTLRQWRESMEELRDIYLDDKAQAALEKELKDVR